jgi:hypothetical protein
MTKRTHNLLELRRHRKNVVELNGSIHALTHGVQSCPSCSFPCARLPIFCDAYAMYERMTKRWAEEGHD